MTRALSSCLRRASPYLLVSLALLACRREPPDLASGHIEVFDAKGGVSLALRARDYGYGLVDSEGRLRARIVLPRNQAVAKAYILAGPVRVDLAGSLVTNQGTRMRLDIVPEGIHLIEESGATAYRLRVNWPDSHAVTVLDRAGKVIGTARTPRAEKSAPATAPRSKVVELFGADGKPRGRVEGVKLRAGALWLAPGLDELERSVLAIYLSRFR